MIPRPVLHRILIPLIRASTVRQAIPSPDDGVDSGYPDRRSETEDGDALRAEI